MGTTVTKSQFTAWLLWAALLFLNVFDWQATEMIMMLGGEEANPLQNKMIGLFGTSGIMYFKAPFLLILAFILMFWSKMTRHTQRTMEIGLAVSIMLYSLLAVWHCILLTLTLHRMG